METVGNAKGPLSWCGTRTPIRVDRPRGLIVCYDQPDAVRVDQNAYSKQRSQCLSGRALRTITVEKRTAQAWTMEPGELCRITVSEGSQVGDVNMWNRENTDERFYSGKTRQLHSSHLSVYDRLWSNLPYLRPMATVVGDTLCKYGVDEDGASCHDVIGTRCDEYTMKLITGVLGTHSCHKALTQAVEEYGLSESDVHDVWNIFMCTGFTKDTHQYFCKPSPARKGDYIEFIADMKLIVALSACPQGDVSTPVGQPVPENLCHPLKVEIFKSKKRSALTNNTTMSVLPKDTKKIALTKDTKKSVRPKTAKKIALTKTTKKSVRPKTTKKSVVAKTTKKTVPRKSKTK